MEKKNPTLEAMDPEVRQQFCRRVLESLSDLVEGEADEDFCRQVDEILGGCEPYLAMRNTFEATIRLTRQLGEDPALSDGFEEEAFARCVEKVRAAAEES